MIKLFYDLETCGLDPMKHSIIQISGFFEVDGKIDRTINYNVRPHPKALIDEEALLVNKKTKEEIMDYPEMEEVYYEFLRVLSLYVNKYDKMDKIMLVGFNNRKFDDIFLRMFFDLCGDKFFGSWFWPDSLDVMVLASEYLLPRRSKMPSFKLPRVAKELGLKVKEEHLHDSLYDVELTYDIYNIVTKRNLEPNDELF